MSQSEDEAGAPVCDKLRVFYNHPGYVAACADRIAEARERLPDGDRELHIAGRRSGGRRRHADACERRGCGREQRERGAREAAHGLRGR